MTDFKQLAWNVENGQTVECNPRGSSMIGKINDNDRVEISPRGDRIIKKNDVVLCKVNGRIFLHLVKAVAGKDRYLIGNNRGHLNGWTERKNVYGVVTKINGREV